MLFAWLCLLPNESYESRRLLLRPDGLSLYGNGEETVALTKTFSALSADIPSLPNMQIFMNSMNIEILDFLLSIVVDTVYHRAATRIAVLSSWKAYLYMIPIVIFINIFYDYLFQSEQFCYTIFHRVYRFLSCCVVTSL